MKDNSITTILIIAIVVLGGLFVYNSFRISSLSNVNAPVTGAAVVNANPVKLPSGIPAMYGSELSVSYDKVQESMDILNQYDDIQDGSRGSKAITLSNDLQSRYIKIGMSIGCEFCCGAQALISKNGQPACGCAHSGAMRGLAKYLLQTLASHFSDQDILNELVKWKTLFFPQQMASTNNQPTQVGGC